MSLHQWTLVLSSFEVLLAVVTLVLLIRAKTVGQYWPLLGLVMSGIVPYFVLLWIRTYRLLSPLVAYRTYFSVFWSFYAEAAICSGVMTFTVFREALRPLKGLQALGTIMYRWAAAVSFAIAFGAALLPSSGMDQLIAVTVSQFLRTSGIIVLSLILFVGLAIKPLGLSLRSRVFGIGIGISVIAFSNILQAGYFSRPTGMYSSLGIVETIFQCTAELIWILYLSFPQPQRNFVLLPTTSPFHAWNQVSERLGHEPGYVAIGGIPPEAFAPAELDIFQRGSRSTSGNEDPSRSRQLQPSRKSLPEEDQEQQMKKTAQATDRLMEAFRSES